MRRHIASAPAGRVRLRDGRALTFRSAGPRDGFPVVYCHGAIGAPRWGTDQLDRLLEERGIRYVMVNRPGFGGSDPFPGRRVIDFADDLGQLMSALGYGRFSVVGVSAGAPYALACGWGMPDRISALVAVSSLGPPEGDGASAGLRYRLVLWPFGPGPVRERLASVSLRALGLARDTAPAAMIADYRVCRAPWGFDPASLRIPVTLYHGRADLLIPLAHGRRLASAIPTCTGCAEAAGGHFFYSRAVGEIMLGLVPAAPAAALAA